MLAAVAVSICVMTMLMLKIAFVSSCYWSHARTTKSWMQIGGGHKDFEATCCGHIIEFVPHNPARFCRVQQAERTANRVQTA